MTGMGLFGFRRARRAAALLALVCSVASQAVLAVAPCVSPEVTPAHALVGPAGECKETAPSSLCLAHCQTADQSSGPSYIGAAPPPDWILALFPAAVAFHPMAAPAEATSPERRSGPPLFLRLVSLLL
jgi:hypothetical protein